MYVCVGMAYLQSVVPDGMEPVLTYFDATYVTGTYRAIRRVTTAQTPRRLRFRRCPPLFRIQTWNVFDATLNNQARTNNLCESWNYGFSQLVGQDHPSVWLLIDAMRKDAVMAMTDIERDGRGEPPRKRVKKATRALQLRLQRICVARRDNKKTVAQTLSAAGHTIRFG